jgi:hypothetical protein
MLRAPRLRLNNPSDRRSSLEADLEAHAVAAEANRSQREAKQAALREEAAAREAARENEQRARIAAARTALFDVARGVPVVVTGSSDAWEVGGGHGGTGWKVTVGNWSVFYHERDQIPEWVLDSTVAAEAARLIRLNDVFGAVRTSSGSRVGVEVEDGRTWVFSYPNPARRVRLAEIQGDRLSNFKAAPETWAQLETAWKRHSGPV